MSANTLRSSLFALVLFGIAGYLGFRHWSTPIEPDNGNAILDANANVSGTSAELVRLGELGPKATPDDVAKLLAAAKNTDPEIRADAAMALGKVQSPNSEVAKMLSEATKDADPGVRSAALSATDELSRATKTPNDPIRAQFETTVIAALKDATPLVRRTAANALGGRPEGSLTNIEAFAKAELAALADTDDITRAAAINALNDLPRIAGPDLSEGAVAAMVSELPKLVKAVAEAEVRSRGEYQGLIRTIAETSAKTSKTPPTAEQSKAIRDALAASLSDKRADARRGVIEAVPTIGALAGTEAERAELLRPLLKDTDEIVRATSYRTLWALSLVSQPEGQAIKAELREATKAWISELANPEKVSRERAAWLLSWTDREDADAAVSALTQLKDGSDDGMKARATNSIEALETAKKSESWPEPSWKPFRTGPPPSATAGVPPAGGGGPGGGGPPPGGGAPGDGSPAGGGGPPRPRSPR